MSRSSTIAATSFDESVRTLSEAVDRALTEPTTGRPTIWRIAVPAPTADPADWLAGQASGSRAYWTARGETRCVAMTGIADAHGGGDLQYSRLSDYTAHMLLGAHGDVRYYGGIRFDDDRPVEGHWRAFGAYRFTLPRIEYVHDGQEASLVCNLVLPRDRGRSEAVRAEIAQLQAPRVGAAAGLPDVLERTDEPRRDVWLDRISRALDAIDDHTLQKVVLARRSTFRLTDNLDPVDLLRALRDATPNRFHFLFEAAPGIAFVGATPERLFRREGNWLFSEAVAGTRPTAEDVDDDAVLRDALLDSEKDQREHLCVRWAIEEILRPFCDELSVDARASEMRLARGRHLVSRFDGVLQSGVDSWDLVHHLHPTPAVGGYPAQAAMRVIRQTEDFDRGWYAGPVGCVGRDVAEFAVALRCGLVADRSLSLYSGAGIVTGSEPASEWDEIEQKIIDFARVMTLEVERSA